MDDSEKTPSWAPKGEPGTAVPIGPIRLPEPGVVLGGRFVVEQQLGSGGSGVVFAAFDKRVCQRVALKIIYPHLVDDKTRHRLQREVQAARQAHPNSVVVFDLHEDSGLAYLSMEMVEGQSLRAMIGERGHLDPEIVIAIGRQVASALANLHQQGLIHRDVKPGNILIAGSEGRGRDGEAGLGAGGSGLGKDSCNNRDQWSEETASLRASPCGSKGAAKQSRRIIWADTPSQGHDLTAKLCDLGLSRPLAHGVTITESVNIVGTPAYMAPEQGRGDDLSEKADIYAFGITLYECLTGTAPLQGTTAIDTLMRRQTERAPHVRRTCNTCPAWLAGLLNRMLDPDPRLRPTASEVERSLANRHLRFRLPVKQLITLAAMLAVITGGWFSWQWLRTPKTARIETAGNIIRGVDDRGREAWHHTLENPIRQVERADLDGDGKDETLVAAWPDDKPGVPMGQLPLSEFVVLKQNGDLITRIRPEELVTNWRHPFAKRLVPNVLPMDLDGDRRAELVLNCKHRAFFPDEILIYWPRSDTWDWVLDHSGHIYDIAFVRDSHHPRLRFLGVNNRLGMLPVAGDMRLTVPSSRERALIIDGVLYSPDFWNTLFSEALAWTFYVPLQQQEPDFEPGNGSASIRLMGDGGICFGKTGSDQCLDSYANPVPGPNSGQDLRDLRFDFFNRLNRITDPYKLPDSAAVAAMAEELKAQDGRLLDEAPYQAILGTATARALARTGDLDRAVGVLRETAAVVPYEDVIFRLANLEALGGRTDQALARLRTVIKAPRTVRGTYDVPQLALRLAIESHDEAAFATWATFLGSFGVAPAQIDPANGFWALARLWWDRPSASDARVRSWTYLPQGNAIACLARWRMGASDAGDPDAMRLFIEDTPDAAIEGRLAMAATLLGRGQPGEALATLENLIATSESDARDDFTTKQLLDLARALHAKALLAAGRDIEARSEAATLLKTLKPDLLPAKLLYELLHASNK